MSTAVVTESRPTRREQFRLRRFAWLLAGLIPALGLLLVALESDLGSASVPDYIIDRDASVEIDEYASAQDVAGSSVSFDIAAVEELQRRSVNPCPAAGESPQVPRDLASSTPMTCRPYDDHGGIAYVVAATAFGLIGAGIFLKRGNNLGLLLLLAALTDVAGGLTSAYALKGLSIKPGSLPAAHVAGALGAIAWVVLLVLIVPGFTMRIPSGRMRSDRWRWLERFTFVAASLLIVTQWLHPFLFGPVANPLRLQWSIETANTLFDVGIQMWMASLAIAVIAPLMNAWDWTSNKLRARAEYPAS